MGFSRHVDWGVGVVFVGVGFVALTVVGGATTPVDAVLFAEYAGTAVVALAISGGGVWLRRSVWAQRDQRQVFWWTVAGGVGVAAIAYVTLTHHVESLTFTDTGPFVLHFAVLGAASGFATRFYQTRTRHERRAAQANLDRFEALFEHAPLPMKTITDDGVIRTWNAAAEDLFGYRAAEVVGFQTPLVPSHRESELDGYLDLLRDENHLSGVRTERQRRDGTLVDVELWAAPMPPTENGTVETLVVLRNVTDTTITRQQQSVLRRVLRHNLRNELTVIRGNAELVTADEADPVDAAASIVAAADRLSHLSTHVGRLERLESAIQSIDVAAVARASASAVDRRHPHATITVDTPAPAWVQTVPMIEDAVDEAVENAVVHAGDDPVVDVTVEDTDDLVYVSITDNGPGVADAEWNPIVEGSEDALQHTSGLGLWVMQWVSARSGGRLSKEPATPQGTIVTFSLPRTANARTARTDEDTGDDRRPNPAGP